MGSTDINPVVTMKRPAILALFLFFLLSTAAVAPFAFRLGQAHSAYAHAGMSQNNTESVGYMERIGSQERCPLLGRNASIANHHFIVDCLPQGKTGTIVKNAVAKSGRYARTIFDSPVKRRTTPLDQAVMASLTGQGTGGASVRPENPLSLALAPLQDGPSPSIFQNSAGFDGGGGGFLPGRGLPNNLIPPGDPPAGPGAIVPTATGGNGPTNNGNNPENPIFDIPDGGFDPAVDPDLVTPIPAALPLMLTGLAGMFAARRRKTAK